MQEKRSKKTLTSAKKLLNRLHNAPFYTYSYYPVQGELVRSDLPSLGFLSGSFGRICNSNHDSISRSGGFATCSGGFAIRPQSCKSDRPILPSLVGEGSVVGSVITTARSRIMRAEGCQRLDTGRQAPEFSREFDRQKPPERYEVALYPQILSRICGLYRLSE